MNVEEIMTRDVRSCGPDDSVAEVVKQLWEADCGLLPVVDGERRLLGVLTDRDICIALATRGQTAGSVPARDVVSSPVHTCYPEEDVRTALGTMKTYRVRRLPVVDRAGKLAGLLSLNDVVLNASLDRPAAIAPEEIVDALQGICAHTGPHRRPEAAGKMAVAR